MLGKVNTISKLVTVTPFRSPYKPEIGHVIIGRVISVNKKSWDVDIFAQRYGTLNLTAINLPRGEQRIRNEDDQMQMRLFFKENDLLSGEIQQIHINGQIHIQTRNLKYGKLKNGILLKVNHSLVKKTKHQFIDLVDDIKAILGLNGIIWIYFSTVKVADEYFNDDKTQIESLNKDEKPDFYSSILIILFRNIIKSLDENEILIIRENILRYYNLYMEHFHKNIKKDDKNNFKKIVKNSKNVYCLRFFCFLGSFFCGLFILFFVFRFSFFSCESPFWLINANPNPLASILNGALV